MLHVPVPENAAPVFAPGHPDAELLRLIGEWRANLAAQDALDGPMNEAGDRYDAIDIEHPTDILTFTRQDRELFGEIRAVGEQFSRADIEGLRAEPRTMKCWDVDDESRTPIIVPHLQAQARADEIVAAYDTYLAAHRVARETSGYAALDQELEALNAAATEMRTKIALLPARTTEGAIAKALMVAWFFDGALTRDNLADVLSGGPPSASKLLAMSVTLDLIEMWDGRPLAIAA